MTSNLIHLDKRGEILSFKGDELPYPEVTLFHTKAGFARGGCIHGLHNEHCCVISGTIEYVIGDHMFTLTDGTSTLIPRDTPHYFKSITDSLVLEWGATEAEKKDKHSAFRRIVDLINDSTD